MCVSLTGYEAVEVGLDGLELVDVVLPLLVRDPPWVVVCAGLTLDLIGGRCRGHRPHRCAFLQTSRKEWSQTIYIYICIYTHTHNDKNTKLESKSVHSLYKCLDGWIDGFK